jgi:hypothetical protein
MPTRMTHWHIPHHHPESDDQDDAEHVVETVAWTHGNHVRITYADGSSMPVIAARTVATAIAEDAGLSATPAPDGTARWARDPESRTEWDAPGPQRSPNSATICPF